MKARLNALLIHGMGDKASFWDPFIDHFINLDIFPIPVDMPSLENGGPESWVNELKKYYSKIPAILVGHSLGAAVAITASLEHRFEGLILLSCPPFFDDFIPMTPLNDKHSAASVAKVGKFLRKACRESAKVSTDTVHFLGEKDIYIPLEQAKRLLFPVVTIPSAGHDLNNSKRLIQEMARHIVSSEYGRAYLDPGARLVYYPRSSAPVKAMLLGEIAPRPSRMDVEITTSCQLSCMLCARTIYRDSIKQTDMQHRIFEKIMNESEGVKELFFVGLGEPLLHKDISLFVKMAADRNIETKLVTNGLLAEPAILNNLREAGLGEVTFSIDTTNPGNFKILRAGADPGKVLENFRSVPKGLRKSIFTTLSKKNINDLIGIIDLVSEEKLPVLAVSDVNFEENQGVSLDSGFIQELTKAINYAAGKNIFLLNQHLHDISDIKNNYWLSLVKNYSDILDRSPRHEHCLAPWRIMVISAEGNISPCNCAPLINTGNVSGSPLIEIWNNKNMRLWRKEVMDNSCRHCHSCPRF